MPNLKPALRKGPQTTVVETTRPVAAVDRVGTTAGWGLAHGCFAIATGLLLAAVLLAGLFPRFSHGSALASAAFALGAAALSFRATKRDEGGDDRDDVLERRFEQLQDLRWELRDTERCNRDLLDAMDMLIVRRDASGVVTFVNMAVCRQFDIDATQVVGTRWSPLVLDTAPLSALDGCLRTDEPVLGRDQARGALEKVQSVDGERWIAWELSPSNLVQAGDAHYVGRDVTAQLDNAHELRTARDAALEANRAKSRFLAAMSHEIRTPMNGILGMASLLDDTALSPEQATYTRAIDQSARNLLSLIDEILDFSKIEAGKLVLVTQPFSLHDCLQSALELLAPRAHEKQIEIASLIAVDVPTTVIGDPGRVRQILLNLISNAVKFTDEGGVLVRVSATQATDTGAFLFCFAVEDTGIGLSAADMACLFAEFEQADAAVQRRDGGTGLGLAISKRLAGAMGGALRVTSELGRGSTFILTLPMTIPATGPSLAVNVARLPSANAPRVLLAFDRPMEQASLAAVLDGASIVNGACRVEAAFDALTTAAQAGSPWDRLIVDGSCAPEQMGALLAHARQVAPGVAVRGIVMVNVLARLGLAPYRRHGFEAYLVRPVRPQSLLEQIGDRAGPLQSAAMTPVSDGLDRPAARVPGGVVLDDEPVDLSVPSKSVLLAEDNAINALLAVTVLRRSGFDVTAVTTGKAAVDAVVHSLLPGNSRFDLILMDIFMPVMDGVAAARAIKVLYSEGGCPPIVALTANAFAEDRQHYLDMGLDDYLSKPFERGDMAALLARWVDRPAERDAPR